PGTSGGYRPALAQRWQTSPDGLHIDLELRPGVRWHDGRAFGVLDVQATLEPLLRADGRGPQALKQALTDIVAIELVAERTVRLVLRRPSDLALRALCDVPMMPDHLLRGPGADPAALGRAPVGTGPFRFAAWERGKRIRLARWPGAWRATAPGAPVGVD